MLEHRLAFAALVVTALAAACTPAKTDATNDGGGGNGGPATTPDGGTSPDGDGGTVTPPGDGGSGPITTCPDATLFSGNPYFDGDLSGWITAGQEKLADPPVPNRHLAVAGQTVFYASDYDVWRTDGTKLMRIAGDPLEAESKYAPTGACSDARFLEIRGMTTLPNGNVLVIDAKGGGIVELQTPTATCTAKPYAGNQTTTLEGDITTDVANQGDVDGAGTQAKFFGLEHITADPQGNVYVVDTGNKKVRKIANDAAHTVSTLYTYSTSDDPVLLSMTVLAGKLYISGANVTSDFLWQIDTQSGQQKQLYSGRGVYPGVDPSSLAVIAALGNDGASLIAGSTKGYVYRVGPDGQQIVNLAGVGSFIDFPTVDLKKAIPGPELPLKSIGVNQAAMALMGSTILWGGINHVGYHVFAIACH